MDKAMARDAPIEIPEKLGSLCVSEPGISNTGTQIRTSARVHKKMRLDPVMTSDKKDSESKDDDNHVDVKEGKVGKTGESKSSLKASEQVSNTPATLKLKRSSPSWSAEEKETFFQALNEYGKDFESIQSVFLSKAHLKNLPENLVKSKEQIRLFYYRTWHKLSKYLKFGPDVKRATQELYALINYGEFRKGVGLLTEKTCVKLNDLIHRGHTHFRIRGKHIKVKTPQCPALQKLNRLDVPEWKEELQLPSQVVVELRPRTVSDWCRVQSVAQNPRVRTLLPLEQRLSSLLTFLQQRWCPPLLQHRDKLLSSVLLAKLQLDVRADHAKEPSPVLHMAPPPGVRITLPTFCLSEYLTSSSLSLDAYQERLANKEALPMHPRRAQSALSRARNRSRAEYPKVSTSLSESTSNKKASVLGKDVDALVAAAAAAAAACEAKAKASAALAGQSVNGTDTKDNTSMSGKEAHSAQAGTNSSGTVPLLSSAVITSSKPSITSASAVMEASVGIMAKAGKTTLSTTMSTVTISSSLEVTNMKSLAATSSEQKQVFDSNAEIIACDGKNSFQTSSEVVNGTDVAPRVETKSESETEAGTRVENESEVESEAEAEVAGEIEAEAQTETESETPVGPEVDVKVDNKAEVKLRAQVKREKAAAKVEAVRQGWSLDSDCAVTIGELYLMFGHEGKVELEYWWEERAKTESTSVVGEAGEASHVASVLQKLVSITKLNFLKSKLLCPCGHVCGAPTKTNSRSKASAKTTKEVVDKPVVPNTIHLEKIAPKPLPPPPVPPPPTRIPSHMLLPTVQDGVFRRPLLAPVYRTSPRTDVEAIKAELEKFRPKYCNRRGRAVRQKGVVVQRMLPLLPKVPDCHPMLALKVIPQTASKMAGEFIPIRPQPEGFSLSHPTQSTSSLHILANDGVKRRQQPFIAPKLYTSAPVTISTPVTTVDTQLEQLQQQQLNSRQLQQMQQPAQQQIVTVAINPSTSTVSSLQQSVANAFSSTETATACSTEFNFSKEEDEMAPSSPPPMSSPPPSISHLLDMDLGSTAGDDISLSGVSCGLLDAALASSNTQSSTSQSFSGLLSGEISEHPGSPPLKLPDQHWLNSEVGDLSLSSLLNNLDSPSKCASTLEEANMRLSDVEAQLQCLMSENSVDYSAKFAVLAAQVAAAAAENKK